MKIYGLLKIWFIIQLYINILYKSLYFNLRKYNLDKDYKEQFTSRNENKHSTQGSILELMLWGIDMFVEKTCVPFLNLNL